MVRTTLGLKDPINNKFLNWRIALCLILMQEYTFLLIYIPVNPEYVMLCNVLI